MNWGVTIWHARKITWGFPQKYIYRKVGDVGSFVFLESRNKLDYQWRIYIVKFLTHPLPSPIFLIFMQFSGKIRQIIGGIQWRIQDFPEWWAPTAKSAIILKKILPKTAWKWKNLDPRGARVQWYLSLGLVSTFGKSWMCPLLSVTTILNQSNMTNVNLDWIFFLGWELLPISVADPGFSPGGRQLPKVLLFFNFLPKTAWKWKNLDPQGGGARVPGAPPWIRQWIYSS